MQLKLGIQPPMRANPTYNIWEESRRRVINIRISSFTNNLSGGAVIVLMYSVGGLGLELGAFLRVY